MSFDGMVGFDVSFVGLRRELGNLIGLVVWHEM